MKYFFIVMFPPVGVGKLYQGVSPNTTMKLQKIKNKYGEARSLGKSLQRATSSHRGYDYRWQMARKDYLREHPFCVHCHPVVVAAVIVDHVVPHRNDMKLFWDRTNWQALCKRCHDQWKQTQEQGAW